LEILWKGNSVSLRRAEPNKEGLFFSAKSLTTSGMASIICRAEEILHLHKTWMNRIFDNEKCIMPNYTCKIVE